MQDGAGPVAAVWQSSRLRRGVQWTFAGSLQTL